MGKYQILIKILDELRSEAPRSFRRYHATESELDKLNAARSRAFIHLFLKVKFGLLTFDEREQFITDGTYDGGVDAYYIDTSNHKIYLIQSKFRTNEPNFRTRDIALRDLLKMDVNRIVNGHRSDENGNSYNEKIQALIGKIQETTDIGRYEYIIVILANVENFRESDLQRLVPGFREIIAFDHQRCYDELVFPLVSGTYYDPEELFININLPGTDGQSGSTVIRYPVKTKYADCHIQILFVPTEEIGRVLYQYKNSILKYNPRSYLSLRNNPVNREIARTIRETKTNEFALFNNGITMLAKETRVQTMTGSVSSGQLYIGQPQIINGGQTAFTLSRIYEEQLAEEGNMAEMFGAKEVMLKIITIADVNGANQGKVLELIEEISKATNKQTAVKEADRRSNEKIQIELQDRIFREFGYFYERKVGEFHDGIYNGYIDRSHVIKRTDFLRAVHASNGQPAEAYAIASALFQSEKFRSILQTPDNVEEMVFAYLCFEAVTQSRNHFRPQKNNPFGVANYGNALKVGRYAVTYVASGLPRREFSAVNISEVAAEQVKRSLQRWLEFEKFAEEQPHNRNYFREIIDPETRAVKVEVDFGDYYKGKTLFRDLTQFFNLGSEVASS